MNNKLKESFSATYPDLKIKEIRPYKNGLQFVVADAKDGSIAMDPFFVYDPKTTTFQSYNPMANLDEFTQLMKGCTSSF